MISTVFMACSDDDDKTSDDKTKPVGAVLYYRMDVSDDMFAALDLTPTGIVEFLWNIDTNGKSTSGSW